MGRYKDPDSRRSRAEAQRQARLAAVTVSAPVTPAAAKLLAWNWILPNFAELLRSFRKR